MLNFNVRIAHLSTNKYKNIIENSNKQYSLIQDIIFDSYG